MLEREKIVLCYKIHYEATQATYTKNKLALVLRETHVLDQRRIQRNPLTARGVVR